MPNNKMQDMAQRIENARTAFLSSLMEQFQYTEEQAATIFTVYKKNKIIKLDPIMGRYTLTHGAFWDKPVLDRALALDTQPAP